MAIAHAVRVAGYVRARNAELIQQNPGVGRLLGDREGRSRAGAADVAAAVVADHLPATGEARLGHQLHERNCPDQAAVDQQQGLARSDRVVFEVYTVEVGKLHRGLLSVRVGAIYILRGQVSRMACGGGKVIRR